LAAVRATNQIGRQNAVKQIARSPAFAKNITPALFWMLALDSSPLFFMDDITEYRGIGCDNHPPHAARSSFR